MVKLAVVPLNQIIVQVKIHVVIFIEYAFSEVCLTIFEVTLMIASVLTMT